MVGKASRHEFMTVRFHAVSTWLTNCQLRWCGHMPSALTLTSCQLPNYSATCYLTLICCFHCSSLLDLGTFMNFRSSEISYLHVKLTTAIKCQIRLLTQQLKCHIYIPHLSWWILCMIMTAMQSLRIFFFSDCSALSYNMMKNNLKRGSVCYKPIFIKFLLFFPQRTGNTHKDTHKLFNSLHKTNKISIILSHLFL